MIPLGAALAVTLGLGLGTLAFRLAFADVVERWAFPPRLRAILDVLPAAALAALVAPGLVANPSQDPAAWALLAAAATTAAVAHRSQNLLWSLGAGMLVFWLLSP